MKCIDNYNSLTNKDKDESNTRSYWSSSFFHADEKESGGYPIYETSCFQIIIFYLSHRCMSTMLSREMTRARSAVCLRNRSHRAVHV